MHQGSLIISAINPVSTIASSIVSTVPIHCMSHLLKPATPPAVLLLLGRFSRPHQAPSP